MTNSLCFFNRLYLPGKRLQTDSISVQCLEDSLLECFRGLQSLWNMANIAEQIWPLTIVLTEEVSLNEGKVGKERPWWIGTFFGLEIGCDKTKGFRWINKVKGRVTNYKLVISNWYVTNKVVFEFKQWWARTSQNYSFLIDYYWSLSINLD